MTPATASPRAKRRKSCQTKAGKTVTDLGNPGWDEHKTSPAKSLVKMSFRCPVTIDTIFETPSPSHVETFYETRNSGGEPFDRLPKAEKLAWATSCHDNATLMGFIVYYSQLFPSLLKSRIKLNAPTYHWVYLDPASAKGRMKLEQRRDAAAMLTREDFTRSIFRGLVFNVDTSVDILAYMKMTMERKTNATGSLLAVSSR